MSYLFSSAHHRKPHVPAAAQDPDWEAAYAQTTRTAHPSFNPRVRSKPANMRWQVQSTLSQKAGD